MKAELLLGSNGSLKMQGDWDWTRPQMSYLQQTRCWEAGTVRGNFLNLHGAKHFVPQSETKASGTVSDPRLKKKATTLNHNFTIFIGAKPPYNETRLILLPLFTTTSTLLTGFLTRYYEKG
jgi:hypothetical protein